MSKAGALNVAAAKGTLLHTAINRFSSMDPEHDALEKLLNRWDKIPAPPRHLNAEVWRRLAIEDQTESRESWRHRVESWFSRPSFAALFIACCVLAGLFAAEIRVARLQNEKNVQLIQSYLHLIDPLVTASSRSPSP